MTSDLTNTAPPAWLDELRSPIESLPTELVAASGRRVRDAALAFGGVWLVMLILANPLSRLLTGERVLEGAWPMPGNAIGGVGLFLSLGLAWYASRAGVASQTVLRLGPDTPDARVVRIGRVTTGVSSWCSPCSGRPRATSSGPSSRRSTRSR